MKNLIFGIFVILLYHLAMRIKSRFVKENLFLRILRIVLLIILSPIVLVFLVVSFVKTAKRKKANKDKISIFNMTQIDSLSGTEFESFLKTLFERLGYEVSLTKKSYDFGADLIAKKKHQISIVQAKCYNRTVGVKAVQEIIGAKNHYRAMDAFVATNNYFSNEAQILASENGIKLLDRDVLTALVKKFDIHIDKEKNNFCAISKKAVFDC